LHRLGPQGPSYRAHAGERLQAVNQLGGYRLVIRVETQLPTVTPMPSRSPVSGALVRRARLLARLGLAWHGVEAAVAITAGAVAGSIALVGFGADSLVEALAGVVVLWRFGAGRVSSPASERRAQQLIAGSFVLVALYVGIEAIYNLAVAERPDVSWVG
jgi:hypothetical protein